MATGTPFDVSALPFDQEAMLAGLRRWVECESPTLDVSSVERMLDLAQHDLAAAGAEVQRLQTLPGHAGAVMGRFPHPHPEQPGILVMGHLDTVHPIGTLAALPWRREDSRCYGPGINDMKAGDYLSLCALRELGAAGWTTPLPVTILYTGDEEIGSPASRALIESTARQFKYILVPEPARPDGAIVLGRHEVVRFALESTGQPTHAGNTPEKGRSAIRQMAEKLIAVEQLSTADATFTVGILRGGLWSNCVATTCTAELLVLIRDPAVREERLAALQALASQDASGSFTITQTLQRPRWEENAGCLALYEVAEAAAKDLGFALPRLVSGGGSDGNFTGALGLPTLDGLGACGDLHHTLQEHIEVDSLVPRTRLMASLVMRLR
ncbi:M20/M25/M40 family metallo-hydrolase [Comamonadaceae bacterium PP-2]